MDLMSIRCDEFVVHLEMPGHGSTSGIRIECQDLDHKTFPRQTSFLSNLHASRPYKGPCECNLIQTNDQTRKLTPHNYQRPRYYVCESTRPRHI